MQRPQAFTFFLWMAQMKLKNIYISLIKEVIYVTHRYKIHETTSVGLKKNNLVTLLFSVHHFLMFTLQCLFSIVSPQLAGVLHHCCHEEHFDMLF